MKKINLKNKNAFTIIELLVAMASFIIIISITAGGFSQALRSQRQTAALINANDNASLALEQMAREIRTGSNFSINNSCGGRMCPHNSNSLKFTNADNQEVEYNQDNFSIVRKMGSNRSAKITANNLKVEYLKFMVSGEGANDSKQPRITILMGIKSLEPGTSETIINLQTTVSPLPLDS